jgi:hypothetical protein
MEVIMARPACGKEMLSLAQQQLSQVSDTNELRILLAVVLPLLFYFQIYNAIIGYSH